MGLGLQAYIVREGIFSYDFLVEHDIAIMTFYLVYEAV